MEFVLEDWDEGLDEGFGAGEGLCIEEDGIFDIGIFKTWPTWILSGFEIPLIRAISW